jgi:AraC family transcriptional regulator, regulatory protein of adaptative response / DNA-3-methyladenine glycosylase II
LMSENGESNSPNHDNMAAMTNTPTLPNERICDQARRSRDARFDGLFFTAVTTTRIYCRPVCPAPAPKSQNIRYFAEAAAAEAAGFRPCLRCRPELAPGSGQLRRADQTVARALRAISAGALSEGGVEKVAASVGVSSRQLRRLFDDELGATPIAVATTQRLLFAKQLLSESNLSIIDTAMASGFQSLRRFNAAFKSAYNLTPSHLRERNGRGEGGILCLQLNFRPPYNFGSMLKFLATRALPGIESVSDTAYRRELPGNNGPAWLNVQQHASKPALQLTIQGVAVTAIGELVSNVRRMFDLDADPAVIRGAFAQDRLLAACWKKNPGLRLPGGFDPFETAVRAVLGQQISVAAARTMARRIVEQFGPRFSHSTGEDNYRLFPRPSDLVDAPLEEIGLLKQRANTLRGMAAALLDGRISFRPESRLDDFVAQWTALPGIGDWTAQYIAMRALSHPDAFPAGDLILRRAAANSGDILSEKALREKSRPWQPWRAYAVFHLWQSTSTSHEQ